MKTILVINDGSAEAAGASEVALSIARRVNADLLLLNIVKELIPVREMILSAGAREPAMEKQTQSLRTKLNELNADPGIEFKPQIDFVDASDFSLNDLTHFINRNNIWMLIKGTGDNNGAYLSSNMQSILNRVACPLLLIPEKYRLKDFERMVYMADLRYCQIPVIKFVSHLAQHYDAKVQVAHVSASGLPDMDESYARSFFSDVICRKAQNNQLYFNNIRDKNLQKVLDVLLHGMKTDMLVLVNHQYHMVELIGNAITNKLPEQLTVPLLIFPS